MQPALGTLVAGKYRLDRLLGDGGMGAVYEATHGLLGTKVAVKLLHASLLERPGLIERFLQEAQVVAQIRSPHVVQVIDVGQDPSRIPYIVMELLSGEPLSRAMERDTRFVESRALDYTSQILTALEAAHALNVIHRDLKPENVFITVSGGRALLKLIDFGIAKYRSTDPGAKNLTVAGTIMGTAEYMAPEQAIRADQVDVRADLYAVGVMLYEMLSGTRPILGEDVRTVAQRAARGEFTPLTQHLPQLRPDLVAIVHRAIAFRPDQRFANASEMRMAVDALRGGPVPAARPPVAELGHGTVMGAPVPAALALTGSIPQKPVTQHEPVGQRPGGTQMAAPVPAGPVPGGHAGATGWAPQQAGPGGYAAGPHGGRAGAQQPVQGGQAAPYAGAYGPPAGHVSPYGAPPPPHGAPPAGYGPPHGHAQRPAGSQLGGAPARATRRKKSIWPWLLLPLVLIGAGVGIVWVATDGAPVQPVQPVPTQPTQAARPSTTGKPADTAPNDNGLGQLTPGNDAPSPPQTTRPPSSSATTKPSAQPSTQPTVPPLFPSGLPPIPTTLPSNFPAIPLPSGMASSFPWLPQPSPGPSQ